MPHSERRLHEQRPAILAFTRARNPHLRPQLGLGNDQISASATPIPISQSSGYFYLEPDLLVLVTLGAFCTWERTSACACSPPGPGVCASGLGTCHSFDSEVTLHAQLGVSF